MVSLGMYEARFERVKCQVALTESMKVWIPALGVNSQGSLMTLNSSQRSRGTAGKSMTRTRVIEGWEGSPVYSKVTQTTVFSSK